MKNLLVASIIVLLSACALPKSEAELVAQNKTESICHKDSVEDTNHKIYGRLAKCYNYSSTVPVMTDIGGGYTSYSSVSTEGKVLSKKTNPGEFIYMVVTGGAGTDYYGLRLELVAGEGEMCPTRINTHIMNGAWQRHVDRIKLWLDDPEAGCSIW